MTGIARIAAERRRQIEVEGHPAAHDATNDPGELAGAGAAYAVNAACLLSPYHGTPRDEPPESWPHQWDRAHWKPSIDKPIRDLERAGALIAAEIDKLLLASSDAAAPATALAWEQLSEKCYRTRAPFFGSFRVEAYGDGGFEALWSVPGTCDTFVDGPFASAAEAMRAIEEKVAADLEVFAFAR